VLLTSVHKENAMTTRTIPVCPRHRAIFSTRHGFAGVHRFVEYLKLVPFARPTYEHDEVGQRAVVTFATRTVECFGIIREHAHLCHADTVIA
jgi:hypothetical protein